MIETPILIVGAGPSGLMLSAQLHRYGAAHVIIDQKERITDLSKALAVQARTLEQYQQLGIAEEVLSQGFIARSVNLVVNGSIRATIPLGEIGAGLSRYPFLFILEQSKNEELLNEHIETLGGSIRWGTELVDVRTVGEGYTGTLKRSDGSIEAFACRYLIGCDGASSKVRHFLEMPFRGGTNEQSFFVADINLEMEIDKQGLLLAINGREFLAFFPMSGPGQFRAVGVLPPGISDPDDFSFDELKEHIERNCGLPVKLTGQSWYSGYRVHHRIVDHFGSGNAFLVGDAAHIHSPAGGQGMNTGLGDAVNLGWKLAAVVNGWTKPNILESYDEERRPFGVQLVHTTDHAFSVMVSRHWMTRILRTYLLPAVLGTLLRFQSLRRLMFKTVSQTRIAYRKSSLSDGSRSGTVRSGDRFPWFEWDGGNSYEWLSNVGFVVLRFGGATSPDDIGWTGPSTQISVEGAAAAAAIGAGLPRHGCVIVRPDMHVAGIYSS